MIKDQGDEALYDKLDSAYPTEDEESEVRAYFGLLDIHFLYVKPADLKPYIILFCFIGRRRRGLSGNV